MKPARNRRGAALLISLATLVLVTMTCATVVRIANTALLRRKVTHLTVIADDLASQAEPILLDWLDQVADDVSLPIDSLTPEIAVLHDCLRMESLRCSLRITAWDQNGLVHWNLARPGSDLRPILPEDVLLQYDSAEFPARAIVGLDNFLEETGYPSPFPTARGGEVRFFGVSPGEANQDLKPDRTARAAGAYIATHGPSHGRINVNTAPISLVAAAMRSVGLGGIERIEAARRSGTPTSVPAGGTSARDASKVELASFSDTWAFRVDVSAGLVSRSWWAVYARAEGSWRCVQRLAIGV